MAFLRLRLAYIIVAVLRSTALRRVVDGSLDHHRHPDEETSSSLLPSVNTVRPHPSGSGRSVLTPGPHRLHRAIERRTFGASRSKDSDRDLRGEVDRPFHIIIAGTVGRLVTSSFDQSIPKADGTARCACPRTRRICTRIPR